MKYRCSNPQRGDFYLYGGRGIKVCDRWMTFSNFANDMGSPPQGFTLDRINNDGNYEPTNCRWASRKSQANNRRSNRYLEIDGITKTVSEWSDFSGINYKTLAARLYKGWSPKAAVQTPIFQDHIEELSRIEATCDWFDRMDDWHESLREDGRSDGYGESYSERNT